MHQNAARLLEHYCDDDRLFVSWTIVGGDDHASARRGDVEAAAVRLLIYERAL